MARTAIIQGKGLIKIMQHDHTNLQKGKLRKISKFGKYQLKAVTKRIKSLQAAKRPLTETVPETVLMQLLLGSA